MIRHIQFLIIGVLYSTLLVCCAPEAQQSKVYGRYVPERKDDFAWENEYAAFRMYGPALANENPSNGVDLWLKNSPALVIDTMYGRELLDHRPYHINYDGNLDCYKVAHTAGCGGVVILAQDSSHLSPLTSVSAALIAANKCWSRHPTSSSSAWSTTACP